MPKSADHPGLVPSSLPARHGWAPHQSRALGSTARRGRPSLARSAKITSDALHVASAMFLNAGFEATTMEAVARSVGVPKTTLYKRYADKYELLRAVVTEHMQSWALETDRSQEELPGSLAERLAHHLAIVLVWATKPEVRAINRLAANLPETHGHELSGRSLWGYESVRQTIADSIRQLAPAANVDPRDPGRVAETLLALVRGWLIGRSATEPIGRAEATETAKWFVALAMGGTNAW